MDKRIKGILTKCGAVNKWDCDHAAFRQDKYAKIGCAFYRHDVDACTYNNAFKSYKELLKSQTAKKKVITDHYQQWLENQEEILPGG